MKVHKPTGVTSALLEIFSGENPAGEEAAVQLACQGYCEYFKGGQSEDGCGGLSAVAAGVVTGKIGLEQVSYLTDAPPGFARRSGCLINELCSRCSYPAEDGCDFMSDSPPPDATPCGGYRLLQALLDAGALTPEVVRVLIHHKEPGVQNT